MTQNPRRLIDDPAGSRLARALREARGTVLSPQAVARVRTGLSASGIATPSAVPGSAGAPAAGPPLTRVAPNPLSWAAKGLRATSLKVGLAIVGLGLLAGAAWRLRASSHEGSPTPSAPAAEAPPAVTPTPIDPSPQLPAQAVTLDPKPPAQAVTMGETPKPPIQPVPITSRPQVTEAAPPPAPRHPTEPARTNAGATPASVPSPREGALLLEARRMLDTDPARALALVQEHEREFPESQLARERARIAAEARRRER